MKVTPALRRAVHLAADLVLDALAAADEEKPPPKRRGPALPAPLPPTRPLTPEEQAQLEKYLARAGYQRK